MDRHNRGSRRENGRESATSLSASEIQTIVRRLGFVALKVHEVVMSRLVTEDEGLAELFNDVFKPMVDALVHFDFSDTEVDDGEDV